MVSSRIFVTGDIHGNPINKKLNERKARLGTKRWPEQNDLGDDDFLVFLGDFGVLWRYVPDRVEEFSIKWLDKKNCTNLVIGGNHENWDRLRSLPMEERWGAQVGIIGYRTFFIPNGSILTLGDKKVFCMGGAMSTDKTNRIIHDMQNGTKSWWEGEIPTKEEMDFGVRNLESVDWKVDYVFTHTMPSSNVDYFASVERRGLERASDPTARYLEFIKNHIEYDKWYCGHFHEDKYYGGVRVVFHDVIEISKERSNG